MIRLTRNEEQPRLHVSSREFLPPLASRTIGPWMDDTSDETKVVRRLRISWSPCEDERAR
jgi:hypothetical protein